VKCRIFFTNSFTEKLEIFNRYVSCSARPSSHQDISKSSAHTKVLAQAS
jgi:hypothetical protein